MDAFNFKKPLYLACFLIALLLSVLLAIPPTLGARVVGRGITECRSTDTYTMVLTYCLASSLLFCFTMSFLFSLCILGSPLLRNSVDRVEYTQRYVVVQKLSARAFCSSRQQLLSLCRRIIWEKNLPWICIFRGRATNNGSLMREQTVHTRRGRLSVGGEKIQKAWA